MKTLNRNKQGFYYAVYLGKNDITDSEGYETGESEKQYGNPVLCRANVSTASGETIAQQFGSNEDYDKIIVTDDLNTPINEYSILWIDIVPDIAADGTTETPHDYIVRRVSKSLNSVSIGISKVDVNATD